MSRHSVLLPLTQIYTIFIPPSHNLCLLSVANGSFSLLLNVTARIRQLSEYTHMFHFTSTEATIFLVHFCLISQTLNNFKIIPRSNRLNRLLWFVSMARTRDQVQWLSIASLVFGQQIYFMINHLTHCRWAALHARGYVDSYSLFLDVPNSYCS